MKEEKPEAILIPVPYEATASGEKGAIKGPKAIIDMLEQLEDYDQFIEAVTWDKVNITSIEELPVKDLAPEEMVKTVKEKIDKIKDSNKFPIVLGGEHSVTEWIVDKLKPKNVVIFDAHPDCENSNKHDGITRRLIEKGYNVYLLGVRTMSKKEKDYSWSSEP